MIAQGKTETNGQELYYRASSSDDANHAGESIDIRIDQGLASASVQANLKIDSCTDEDGDAVTGVQCPVGRAIGIDVVWGSAGAMTNLGSVNSAGRYPGRGRLCSASGTIGSEYYHLSQYALIVENLTYQ